MTTQLDLLRLAHTDEPLSEAQREGYERLLERLVVDLDARAAALPGAEVPGVAAGLVLVLLALRA